MKRIPSILPLSFLIVFGGGFFAFADTGESFHNWYNKRFSISLNQPALSTINLADDMKRLVYQSKDQLFNSQIGTTSYAKDAVNKHLEEYITELETTTKELKKQTTANMEDYKKQKKQKEIHEISNDADEILMEVLNEN